MNLVHLEVCVTESWLMWCNILLMAYLETIRDVLQKTQLINQLNQLCKGVPKLAVVIMFDYFYSDFVGWYCPPGGEIVAARWCVNSMQNQLEFWKKKLTKWVFSLIIELKPVFCHFWEI